MKPLIRPFDGYWIENTCLRESRPPDIATLVADGIQVADKPVLGQGGLDL